MASMERLQNEILLKEEAFLKEERAKLTEQLNKLKVEEMALMKMLKPDNTNSHQTTVELFTKNSQLPSLSSQRIDSLETESEVNHIPLQGLNTIKMSKEDYQGEEEEDEDEDNDDLYIDEDDDDDNDMEDDDTGYSQQLLNAMSSLHYQNSSAGQDLSRSVLHSVLQEEIDDLDDEDDYVN